MKLLNLNLSTLILRFYLLMAIVIGAGFSGYWALSILALPLFMSALLGIKVTMPVWHFQRKRYAYKRLHQQAAH